MAATSGGTDWPTICKPLINFFSGGGGGCVKARDLAQYIISAENSILKDSNKTYETFYTSFAVLSAKFLADTVSSESKEEVDNYLKALDILLERIVSRLSKHNEQTNDFVSTTALSLKQFLLFFNGICKGNFPSSEQAILVNILKTANTPTYEGIIPKKVLQRNDSKGEMEKAPNTSASMIKQFSKPVLMPKKKKGAPSRQNSRVQSGDSEGILADYFHEKVSMKLRQLKVSEILLELFYNMGGIRYHIKSFQKYQNEEKMDFMFAAGLISKQGYGTLLKDATVILSMLALPMWEPLTHESMKKLSTLALSCLFCAVSTMISFEIMPQNGGSRLEEAERLGALFVEKSIEIYNCLGAKLRKSPRAGGHTIQNHSMMGVWVILSGMYELFYNEKNDRPLSDADVFASQKPCLNNMGLGLITYCIRLMSMLFEISLAESFSNGNSVVASLDLLQSCDASQRLARVFHTVKKFPNFCFYIASVVYHKSNAMSRRPSKTSVEAEGDARKKEEKKGRDGEGGKGRDDRIDPVMVEKKKVAESDDSESEYLGDRPRYSLDMLVEIGMDGDGDELILGQWLQDALSSGTDALVSPVVQVAVTPAPPDKSLLIPDKDNAAACLTAATDIFNFLNRYVALSDSVYVTSHFKNTLVPQDVSLIAEVIRDLEERTETSVVLGDLESVRFYKDFSEALMQFLHNSITDGLLKDETQWTLLKHFKIELQMNGKDAKEDKWPLKLGNRILSLLAQIVLTKANTDAICAEIWSRVINTLWSNVLNSEINAEMEDLNLEHLETLIFFFYNLNFMQKKSILWNVANRVAKGKELRMYPTTPLQIFALARIIQIFDHFIKHLYDPPQFVLDRVHWNILDQGMHGFPFKDNGNMDSQHFPWSVVENNYRKNEDEIQMKPLFYNVSRTDNMFFESPKLDGLACTFLVSNSDGLSYPDLIDSLLWLAKITDHRHQLVDGNQRTEYAGLCALQYVVMYTWRVLLQLPMEATQMEKLVSGGAEELRPSPIVAYAALYGQKYSAGSNYYTFVKEALTKQIPPASVPKWDPVALMKVVSQRMSDFKFTTDLTHHVLNDLKFELTEDRLRMRVNGNVVFPKLTTVMYCDMMLVKTLADKDQSKAMDKLTKPLDKYMTEADRNEMENFSRIVQRDCVKDIVPQVVRLMTAIVKCLNINFEDWIIELGEESENTFTKDDVKAFELVRALSASGADVATENLFAMLPHEVRQLYSHWTNTPLQYHNLETYQPVGMTTPVQAPALVSILNYHLYTITEKKKYSMCLSIKHLLVTCIKFINVHMKEITDKRVLEEMVKIILPFTCDATMQCVKTRSEEIMVQLLGESSSDKYQLKRNEYIFRCIYDFINIFTSSDDFSACVKDSVLQYFIGWLANMMEYPLPRRALDKFCAKQVSAGTRGALQTFLLAICNPRIIKNAAYSTYTMEIFNKLFTRAANDEDCAKRMLNRALTFTNPPKEALNQLMWRIVHGTDIPYRYNAEGVSSALKNSMMKASKKRNSSGTQISSAAAPIPGENLKFLENLVKYLALEDCNLENKEGVAYAVLESTIIAGNNLLLEVNGYGFVELMNVMIALADVSASPGHTLLFENSVKWAENLYDGVIFKQKILLKLHRCEKENSLVAIVDAVIAVLNYVSIVCTALCPPIPGRFIAPPWDTEILPETLDLNVEWPDELSRHHDKDGKDSKSGDTDEDQHSKLCTFTVTQKEFMNQHWYHCHTCKMVDKVGVCSVCARLCHKGHDVTYSKYGNFFCDCGAKTASCKALAKKRTEEEASGQETSSEAATVKIPLPSDFELLMDALASVRVISRDQDKLAKLSVQLEPNKKSLLQFLWTKTKLLESLVEMVRNVAPIVEAVSARTSPIGCYQRAKTKLESLHISIDKKFESVTNLMKPTLGSQEGAFENVRLTYSGDQGQIIKQLVHSHLIRKSSMCCLNMPGNKRPLLAVSQEKGKITVLELSGLLKQNDLTKKKLTLQRLSTTTAPFTVLSVTANPCNNNFLAVCGLKEMHVLSLQPNGSFSEHLKLLPQLEPGNYIIRAMWLPGSQTWLAIVTADFVKIYDLGKDVLSPQYFFLVPAGKIRDVTFICPEIGDSIIVLMSSIGYIYTQTMNAESSASQGTFYVTNTLHIDHPSISDTGGQVCGGGVSVYYSHSLRALFFSYTMGKNFMAFFRPYCRPDEHPFGAPNLEQGPNKVYEIKTNPPSSSSSNSTAGRGDDGLPFNKGGTASACSTSGSNSNGGGSTPSPLYQWTEVLQHPGLVCAISQLTNSPVVMMVKPDGICVQDIVLPSKFKVLDTVILRHTAHGGEMRTTLILLCEDGSLRMYMAQKEETGFWLSPCVRPTAEMPLLKNHLKNKKNASLKSQKDKSGGKNENSSGFPVDFFEYCSCISEVEFGGNDLLQVYNAQQIKMRLNTPGMYVASTKPTGFEVTITSTDSNQVITGVRVLLGSVGDTTRVPSFIDVMSQIMPTIGARNRWFDIPLAREVSVLAGNTITVNFGPSADSNSVTIVDSIKVYGKSKEAFGWPDDTEDCCNYAFQMPSEGRIVAPPLENDGQVAMCESMFGLLDKLMCNILETTESVYWLKIPGCTGELTGEMSQTLIPSTMSQCHTLITGTVPFGVKLYAKMLLASFLPSKMTYHGCKDSRLLRYADSVLDMLESCDKFDMDPELYHEVVVMTRNVAVSRPAVLQQYTSIKFSSQEGESTKPQERLAFLKKMLYIFWQLHDAKPKKCPTLFSIAVPGLQHVETTVYGIVEVINAFMISDRSEDVVDLATKLYEDLLLCEDSSVSYSAKLAIVNSLMPKAKRKQLPIYVPRAASPVPCSSKQEDKSQAQASTSASSVPSAVQEPPPLVQEPPGLEGPPSPMMHVQHNLDYVGFFNNMNAGMVMDEVQFGQFVEAMPHDVDDDSMVEIAIALSLQDQQVQDGHQLNQDQEEVIEIMESNMGNMGIDFEQLEVISQEDGEEPQQQPPEPAIDASQYSDATFSIGGSDDEGSNAATDGSTLRTSPGDQEVSEESESGDSVADSVIGEPEVSGRSSASDLKKVGSQEVEGEGDGEDKDLHELQTIVLEKLILDLPTLKDYGGLRIIPFMQVIFMLTSDLDAESESDRYVLHVLISTILALLKINPEGSNIKCLTEPLDEGVQTGEQKFFLILLRLLSILMSHMKATNSKTANNKSKAIASLIANSLLDVGVMSWCLHIHTELLPYWKMEEHRESAKDSSSNVVGMLLKPMATTPVPDTYPFFLKQYVKNNNFAVFDLYPRLLTEITLRLPYQILKHGNKATNNLDQRWFEILCEYMMMSDQTPFIRRQVRKVLMFISNNKDNYRKMRDMHALKTHIKAVMEKANLNNRPGSMETMPVNLSLPYDALVEITEHLKACVGIVSVRRASWQSFIMQNKGHVSQLFLLSVVLDEGVAQIIIQLLYMAVSGNALPVTAPSASANQRLSDTRIDMERFYMKYPSLAPRLHGKMSLETVERKKVEESVAKPSKPGKDNAKEEAVFKEIVKLVHQSVDKALLAKFLRTFLLETNLSHLRWHAHCLIYTLFTDATVSQKASFLELMWSLWPEIPHYGRKASHFVNLLGYFTIKYTPSGKGSAEIKAAYLKQVVQLLQSQNTILTKHPNATLYAQISQYVDVDAYYLESEPCLVCNNPEVPFTSLKLSSIKVDSKFTTTTQIVKLAGTHAIAKITLRIGDVKRTKMVKTMNIYYNNRAVQAVVELKNKPALWHKAKKLSLTSGQTDVKIDFVLPIIACNLMIEYADFYENLQASAETLQCPRCSANVASNPGVCSNCGENVFQCHKCRAINYDEKDPFLCNVCGFCKYAKFEVSLMARLVCAIEPIANDEDRKKVVSLINLSLEKADRAYQQLVGYKPSLEACLRSITDSKTVDVWAEDFTYRDMRDMIRANEGGGGDRSSLSGTTVSRAILQLAQRYSGDCRNAFEELSKVIQRILVCRKELVAYDRAISDADSASPANYGVRRKAGGSVAVSGGNCYGCALSAVEYCLVTLNAFTSDPDSRKGLCEASLIRELVERNMRRGNHAMQEKVRQLLCHLVRDNYEATSVLCELLIHRISWALQGMGGNSEVVNTMRHEMVLLNALLQKEDTCWEQKSKYVMQLFLISCREAESPAVIEALTLPCLNMIYNLAHPEPPTSKKHRSTTADALATVKLTDGLNVDLKKWLSGDSNNVFEAWKRRMPLAKPTKGTEPKTKEEWRQKYLMERYFKKWRYAMPNSQHRELKLTNLTWLRLVVFNNGSKRTREVACNLLQHLALGSAHRKEVLDLMTGFLGDVSAAGPCASEFLTLYHCLLTIRPWKQYLTLKGVLTYLSELLTIEIQKLHALEETSLASDLSQGFVLKKLTELISSFLDVEAIKQRYKGRLVGAILNGYISLKRLVVQRTRIVDETEDRLLELLEDITTGTVAETKEFMAVCVKTVRECPPDDIKTPQFIFERLCSVIYPEENEIGEFFLSIEKDPQQEDFLQGRMLGNPYSSNEPGLGPLMRDVKNKICQDCELVALLEDDNGMELLVNNKIISLDLPVKLVYKKLWLADGGEGDSMRVVYRMRGLLGDATEEFIESLDVKSDEAVNNEEVYKMANIMGQCGGLKVLLDKLDAIRDIHRMEGYLNVILKLLLMCVKVECNQQVLIIPRLKTVPVMLRILHMSLSREQTHYTVADQVLEIVEVILTKASTMYQKNFLQFGVVTGSRNYVEKILAKADLSKCVPHSGSAAAARKGHLAHLPSVIAALTYGDPVKMSALTHFFKPILHFKADRTSEDEHKLEFFCNLVSAIVRNDLGNSLKDHIMSLGVVDKSLSYITSQAPSLNSTFWKTDDEEWKEYVSRPALKYVIRILTGLAQDHIPTQMAISAECICIIHRLEQVSSNEHVGTLAENLLEALRTNPEVATRIETVREETRAEKKRLAMAMRQKQLGALGMKTNEKGQVTAEKSAILQMEDLTEETGLVCVICREGYRFQPSKVLGIYTFTKRCPVEPFERKRKTYGYSTVSHFNVVHVDCHMSAVRLARARDEWESAALQNANTKCNGLLPMWGLMVPESAFASCLARHNTYLQECTGHRDITHTTSIHDLKLLLLRFAREKSLHEDSGGGGHLSNMQLAPYIVHVGLYVLNIKREFSQEEKNLRFYLETASRDKWISSAFDVEGPHYWCVASLMLHSLQRWKQTRLTHLKRLIVVAHVRQLHPLGSADAVKSPAAQELQSQDYNTYKSACIFFALVDAMYKHYFAPFITAYLSGGGEGGGKSASEIEDERWPTFLSTAIRSHDEIILRNSEKIIAEYTEELLPCASFAEFADVAGLLAEIESPSTFIAETLTSLLENTTV